MLDSLKIKREIIESLTFSMEEAALIAGVSLSKVKNICAGRSSNTTMEGIAAEEFDSQKINLYKKQNIDFIQDSRGSYPNYRIFFHGVEKIIKMQNGHFKSKDNFSDFVKKEKEKVQLRANLLEQMEKKFTELTRISGNKRE